MRSKVVFRVFFVLAGILIYNTAQAAGSWYIGLGVGQSQADLEADAATVQSYAQIVHGLNCTSGGISCSTDVDDSDTAYKLFAGYRLNNYLAVEGVLASLGKPTAKAVLTDGADPISVDTSFEVDGFGLAALGFLPLSNTVSLFGKVGAFHWDLRAKQELNDEIRGFSASLSDDKVSGTDPMFGVGAEFTIGRYTRVRAEFEQIQDVGSANVTGQSDVKAFFLNILSGF